MTKTAELVLSLCPNQGWWVTAWAGSECDGTLNSMPFGSSAEARTYAEHEAKRYQRRGYETHISESRNTLPPI